MAAVIERAPPRLTKKLDAAPEVAGDWSWALAERLLAVTTEAGERVTVASEAGIVDAADALSCTCLLAPKCFHVLAVASYLPVARAADQTSVDSAHDPADVADLQASPSQVDTPQLEPEAQLAPERRRVAQGALAALASALEPGLAAMGALARAELLRSVHAARVHGLHRLASRTLAVAEAGRALRERSATFELEQAVRALGDAAVIAHQLAHGVAEREVIGVARRAYEDIGAKRLVGVACEPVVTGSGYAGVVTYVVDDAGEIFSVQDVAPGDAKRALASYRATVRLGEASLTHGELSRKGLFVQSATASRDRRLGAGARVAAVSGAGATFEEAPIAALFGVPFAAQIDRALAERGDGEERGPALVFVRGRLLGAASGGALFAIDAEEGAAPTVVTLAMPSSDAVFACNENLRLLRAAVGVRMHVVGKVARRRARVIELFAIGGVEGSLSLAADSAGKVQVAFDALARGQLRAEVSTNGQPDLLSLLAGAAATPSDAALDPIAAIERRVGRMVLGGRRSLTTSASRDVAIEAATLTGALLPTARRALEELLAASATTRRPAEAAPALLAAWTRAYVVTMTLRRALAMAAWAGPVFQS